MDDTPPESSIYPSSRVAWGGMIILVLAFGCSFADRQIMTLLVKPIRDDLAISDIQFSLLHGLAFALFYTMVGIPIGRLVDRGHRPLILAIGIAIWSLFTAFCGLARNFWMLFFFRMGVGIGEATATPVTFSLVSDYFPPTRRGIALGVFGTGVYLGIGGAMMVGGWLVGLLSAGGPIEVPVIGPIKPWQQALMVVGLPGLGVALLSLLLFEPRKAPGAGHVWEGDRSWHLVYYRDAASGIVPHHLATALMSMALLSSLAWGPEYLRRSFGLPAAEAGFWMGVLVAIFGTCGVLVGGWTSDRLAASAKAGRLITLGGAASCGIPGVLLFSMAPSAAAAYAGFALVIFSLSATTSVGAACVQELYPPHLRGTGAAVYQLTVNLIGLSLGPTCVALLTDHVFRDEQRLGDALAVSTPIMLLLAVVSAWLGRRGYDRVTRAVLAA